MAKIKQIRRKSNPPRKSEQVPATVGMLNKARHELKAEIASFRLHVGAQFKRVDARFEQIDARFRQVDARFDRVEASILDVKSDVQNVLAAVHRIGLLVEDQNARNKYVLDSYTSLSDRIDKLEKKSEPNP